MSTGRSWREIKAEAHRLHPEMADPDRRAAAGAQLDAQIAGFQLKQLRQSLGKTQADVARALGASQARVSQIEHGSLEAMEFETLRAYAVALGGRVEVTVSVGSQSDKVAQSAAWPGCYCLTIPQSLPAGNQPW